MSLQCRDSGYKPNSSTPAALKIYFKEYKGKPLYQFYMEEKMGYAAELLKQGYKANEVSTNIGYISPIKFNKMFQKHFGITPHKYRKSNASFSN